MLINFKILIIETKEFKKVMSLKISRLAVTSQRSNKSKYCGQ